MLWTDHVEGDYVFERDVACRVLFDEGFVYPRGTASCWETEDERGL